MITSTFSVGNASLAAQSAGAGQPLICLHAGVADKRMWRAQMAHFSGDYQVISYDRREYGETSSPDEAFRHIDDLAALIEQWQLTNPVIMGCSQGGRVAIDFAIAHPGIAAALILVSTALSGADAPAHPPDIQQLVDALDAAEEQDDIDEINRIEAHMWLDGPQQANGRVGGDLRRLFLEMNGCALRHPPLYAEQDPPSAVNRLADLTLPIMLLHGALDFPHVIARHHHLAAQWPQAQSFALDGCAHLPTFEQPQAANRLIQGFLAELD